MNRIFCCLLFLLCSFAIADSFTDSRDGKVYKTEKMPDGKIWMTENLNYETGNSWCYDNRDDNCDQYGRLYDWETAKGSCPAEWHLPNDQEYKALLSVLGTSDELSSRFSALPAGAYFSEDNSFEFLGDNSYFWSATESDANDAVSLYVDKNTANMNYSLRVFGLSVRCIQNSIPVPEKTPEKKAKQSAPKKSEKVEAASAPQKTKKKVAKKVTEDVDNSDKHIPSYIEGAGDNAGGNESKIRWVPIGISAVAIVGGAVMGFKGDNKAKAAYKAYDNGENSFRKSTDDAHNGQTLRTAGIITAIVGALGLGISIAF